MKTRMFVYCRMVLVALASVALPTSVVHAQTVSTSLDDLILGFYANGAPGQTLNLEVDLGNMSNFYNATGSIPLPALAVQDLVDTYGASWSTRTDLFWGAVSTTGRAAGTADGHAPVGTLWATAANGQAAFNRGTVFAQKAASPNIEAMVVPSAGGGSLDGASSTSNSADAAVIDATLSGSWSAQDLKTSGTSFGYFNPTVDNTANTSAGGQVVSDLYELQPTNASGVAGTLLGRLILTQSGLSFQVGGGVAPPVAGFSASPTNGTAPLLVNFTDASTGTITTRQWTFGDGGTSSATSPSYTYSNAGVFSVSLQVIGPGGSNTLNLANLITVTTNSVSTPPVLAIVSPTDFQSFTSASIVLTGTVSDTGSILSVTVNGTAATVAGTNWSGSATLALGTNLLTVIATDNSANTATQSVHAVLTSVPVPVADFNASPTNGAAPLVVNFTNTSTGSITSWNWNFGDGGTSTATNPSHSYTTAGVFSVSLQVIGPGGSNTQDLVNLITVTTNIVSSPPSLTILSPTDFQTFTNASLIVTGTVSDISGILSVTVNGTTATLAGANWSEPVTLALGTNILTVIATDNSANTATQIVHAVLVPVPSPVAGFSAGPTNGAAPLMVNFTDSSTGTITNRSWTFGDGATSTVTSPSHTYTNAGVFSVSLQVSGPGGSSVSNRVNLITVTNTNAPPAPPVLTVSSPTDYQAFTNASLVVAGTASDSGSILSVTVNGAAATLSATNWSEQVTLALGTNALTVIATDNSANTATQVVHAVLAPSTNQAPFIVSAPSITNALLSIQNVYVVVAGDTNVFNVGATDNSGLPLSYQWQFGDGASNNSSLFSTAQHAYAVNNCGPVTANVTVTAGGASITSNLTVAVACQLAVSKVQAKLNFAKANSDGYTLTAAAQLSPDFLTTGQTLALDVGGAQETFTLDSKGRGVNEEGTCRLAFSKATKKRAAVWTVTIKLSHGAFADAWAPYGLTNTTTKDASVELPVVLMIGNEAFADDPLMLYTAKSGKTGTAK